MSHQLGSGSSLVRAPDIAHFSPTDNV